MMKQFATGAGIVILGILFFAMTYLDSTTVEIIFVVGGIVVGIGTAVVVVVKELLFSD